MTLDPYSLYDDKFLRNDGRILGLDVVAFVLPVVIGTIVRVRGLMGDTEGLSTLASE